MLITAESEEETEASCVLGHAHKQNPDDIQLTEAFAETLAQAGKTTEATRIYESILKTNSNRIQSWMGLGWCMDDQEIDGKHILLPKSTIY